VARDVHEDPTPPMLRVEHLSVGRPGRRGHPEVRLVQDVSFEIRSGERYGIAGESGSGKSLTLKSIAGLLPRGLEVLDGSICFQGEDLVAMPPGRRARMMGTGIAMIFQEPMTALNPTMRVGRQVAEGPRRHLGVTAKQANEIAVEMLAATGIPDASSRAQSFPHELSGGLRQRVMIAIALACKPKLVLCDEPTTALDVTVQNQVLELLSKLCDEIGTALAFVTHDLAVINETCTRLSVMYGGRVMEAGPVADLYSRPGHPYTQALLASAPDFDAPGRTLTPIPGAPPDLSNPPPGCPFAPRCAYALDACRAGIKALEPSGPGRWSACDRRSEIFEVMG
jgi:oligopeptide/dipeptide ABC transporter ATP-binding protein